MPFFLLTGATYTITLVIACFALHGTRPLLSLSVFELHLYSWKQNQKVIHVVLQTHGVDCGCSGFFFKKKKKNRNWIWKSGTNLFFIMFFKSYCLPLEDNFLFYVFQINQELCFFFLWKQKYLGNGDSLVVSYNSVQNVNFVISRSNLLFNLGFKLNSVRTILRWLSPLHMSKSYLNDRQKHGLTLKKSNW